jgi:FtsZ-interacting cell division protein ZipA
MDFRELLGIGFAIAAVAILIIGIWAASHYSSGKAYERQLRMERRRRRERKRSGQREISEA